MSKQYNITYILLRKILGFILLSIFTSWIFIFTFFESVETNLYFSLILLFVFFFLTVRFLFEMRFNILSFDKIKPTHFLFEKSDFNDFFFVVLGSISTFVLNHIIGLNAILASGLIGLMGVLFFKKYAIPIFCGSFIAMASSTLPNINLVIIFASIIGGIVLVVCKDLFVGYGGKLGTIAFISCIITGAILNVPLFSTEHLILDFDIMLIVYAVVGAILTYFISIKLNLGSVIASSTIGIISGFLLPLFYGTIGFTYAALAYCGSFAGMSSKKEFPIISYMLLSGLICGLVFIFSTPFIDWAGGKLGAIAFGSVVAVKGFDQIINKLKN